MGLRGKGSPHISVGYYCWWEHMPECSSVTTPKCWLLVVVEIHAYIFQFKQASHLNVESLSTKRSPHIIIG